MDYFISLAVAKKVASINSWEQKTGRALDAVEMLELRGLLDRNGQDAPQADDVRLG